MQPWDGLDVEMNPPDDEVRDAPAAQEWWTAIGWVLSCVSAGFSGMGLFNRAARDAYPRWTGVVGGALLVMAVVVMVGRRWRRRHPDLVLVPLALALFASHAVRTGFGPADDRGLAIFLAGTGAFLIAWVFLERWRRQRSARSTS
jgi:hypothetical protein